MAFDTGQLTQGDSGNVPAGVTPIWSDPNRFAMLAAALQQAQPSATAPTAPTDAGSINPGPGTVLAPASPFPSDTDEAMKQALLKSTQYGQQATEEQIQRARTAGDLTMPLIKKLSEIPVPPRGKQWHVGTWTDPQGIVHHPNFLQNLGNILGMVGTATRPGQAMEAAYYGPGIRKYEAETGALAKQIQDIQEQQRVEQQPIPATAGLVYHPMMAQARMTQAEASQSRADSYKKYVDNIIPIRQGLMQIAAGNLTERQRHDRVAEWLQKNYIDVERDKNGIIRAIGMGGLKLRADEFNAAVANKNQGVIDQILGDIGWKSFMGVPSPTGETQAQPLAPGSSQPFPAPAISAPGSTPAAPPTSRTGRAQRIKATKSRSDHSDIGFQPDQPQ